MTDQQLVRAKVYSVIGIAREIFKDYKIPVPEISFSNRMTSDAGKYTYDRYDKSYHVLTFSNSIISNNDIEAFCEDTVIHEVAHLVDKVVFGSTAHNARFYNIMRMLGHKNPTRCHKFKVVRNRKTFTYQCKSCGEIVEFSSIRHNKVQNNKRAYFHTSCGRSGRFKFIG